MKPDNGGSKLNSTEECSGPLVVSGGKASALLAFGEEVFKQVSGFRQFLSVSTLPVSVFPWQSHGLHTQAVVCGRYPNRRGPTRQHRLDRRPLIVPPSIASPHVYAPPAAYKPCITIGCFWEAKPWSSC